MLSPELQGWECAAERRVVRWQDAGRPIQPSRSEHWTG